MLEFSLLIPLLVILIGAIVSFGLFFFQANVLQQAVDIAAQEISRMPFEPEQELGLGDFDKCNDPTLVCNDEVFKEKIYDEQFLVIHDSEWNDSTPFDGNFQMFADQLPLLNRLLVPVMIRDNDMTRYPGTIVQNMEDQETILIPIVEYRQRDEEATLPFPNDDPPSGGFFPTTICTSGETIVQWVAPVEEIRVDHDNDPVSPKIGPFALGTEPELASFEPGMVALRINYPAQSTTLLNRTDIVDADGNPNCEKGGCIVIAGDTVVEEGFGDCYMIVDPSARISPACGKPGSNPNSGEYGLGELEALTRIVRPYRKVMSTQAIYRREVFR